MARPGISTKYTEKIAPRPKFWNPKKIPQNTPKIPKTVIFGILGVFFRYFWGIFRVNSGSPEFQAGGYFFGIFCGNSGSGHLGALQQAGAFSRLNPCKIHACSEKRRQKFHSARRGARCWCALFQEVLLVEQGFGVLVAHDCGYPLSRYTCRATRVAADFLDFKAFCRCSTGVALHPLKILVSHLSPPGPGRCHTEIWV